MIISVLYPSWLHSAQFISVLVHNEEDFSGFLITSLDADKTLLNLTQLLHGQTLFFLPKEVVHTIEDPFRESRLLFYQIVDTHQTGPSTVYVAYSIPKGFR